MDLIYLKERDIEMLEYIAFYEKYHGYGSFRKRRERIHWYFHSEGFRLLVAVVDGKYVGQSGAYKTTVIVQGKRYEWWWGVDTFALAEMRGKGIGKALQKKLHEDCLNFSSASYSAINGVIKKKCGGHEIMRYHQYFCPVSCYCTLYSELVLKKLVNRNAIVPRIRLPYFYAKLNKSITITDYDIRLLTQEDYNESLSAFMEECLKDYCFHVRRTPAYMRWKYIENPSIDYVGLEVIKDCQREAIVFFTNAFNGKFTISNVRISKILDAVIKAGSELTQTSLLEIVVNYFKEIGDTLDGLLTLIPSDYWPQIQYPTSTGIYLLSTLDSPLLTNGYVAFSDQDMEQMYENE